MIKKKYHFIYKTTNTITDKYYIGMHSTDDLDDGYVGSGKYLWNSINKHGIDNHVRKILEYCPNREKLAHREAEIVNEERIVDKLCMNLKPGGTGGFINPYAGGFAYMEKFNTDEKFRNKQLKRLKEMSIKAHRVRRKKYPEGTFKGKVHTNETKQKMSLSSKGNGTGKDNSQYGTCWVCSLELKQNKKIKKSELDKWISSGWTKGRKYF